MAKLNMKRIQELSILAIAVMIVQVVLSKYIYPVFGKSTQQLFAITPQTAITSPTIGNKVIGLLSGIIPFDLGVITNWVAIFIGALVLLIVGYWIYDQRWAYKGKNIYQRLWMILLYGSAALYIFLLVTKLGVVSAIAFPLLIGVAVNYLIIAVVITQLAKRVKVLRI